jgi:hypothetical protein
MSREEVKERGGKAQVRMMMRRAWILDKTSRVYDNLLFVPLPMFAFKSCAFVRAAPS